MVLNILVFIGIAVGLVTGFIIRYSRFFSSRTNNFLAYAIFVLTLLNFFGWLETEQPLALYLSQLMWEYLFPSFLLIYFLRALNRPLAYSMRVYWLLTPFLISTFIRTILALDYKFGWYDLPVDKNGLLIEGFDLLDYNLSFMYNLVLMVWSYVLIITNRGLSAIYRKWLKRLCIFVFILLATWFLLEYFEVLLGWDYWIVLWLIISIFFFWSVYYGLFKLHIVNQTEEIHAKLSGKPIISTVEISKPTKGDHYAAQLQNLMEQNELYKNPDLSRDVVAERLGISSGYLSQLVGDLFECGFVEYVNKYRVETAKIMLLDEEFDKFSLHAIGMEAGFKSKSAFYTTFQKYTQLTPGQYKTRRKGLHL